MIVRPPIPAPVEVRERDSLADVTSSGYIMAMNTVRIADLKARLSEYLRRVRRGHEVTVLDRQTPIARIVPYGAGAAALEVRKPLPGAPPLHRVPLPPPRIKQATLFMRLIEQKTCRHANGREACDAIVGGRKT